MATETKSRQFHLGDILSITTPYLVSPNHFAGIEELVAFMVGAESLGTLTTRVMADDCINPLREQLPFLKEITLEGRNANTWRKLLDSAVAQYGEYHPVYPIRANMNEVSS